jgi:hypothetical protein
MRHGSIVVIKTGRSDVVWAGMDDRVQYMVLGNDNEEGTDEQ